MGTSAQATEGVTLGASGWRAIQNRLLGPFAVLAISSLGVGHVLALKICTALIFVLNAAVFYMLVEKVTNSAEKAIGWLSFFSLFRLYLQRDIYFVWDSFELLLFTCLAYVILFRPALPTLLALFFIGLLNRESALLISVFIFIDGWSYVTAPFRIAIDKTRLALGAGLTLQGWPTPS